MPFLPVLLASPPLPQTVRPQPEVGFVWHYPFVDKGSAEISKTGVDSMIARAAWSALEPEEGRYDWSNLDRQLAEARKGGYKLVLLLECNPFCSPAWVVKKTGEAGENVVDASGHLAGGPHGGIPQANSATFDRMQSAFLKALTNRVKEVDAEGTIATYQPGIEWWFPYEWRHAPADIARFQSWMKGRYGSIGAVNRVWKAAYANFDGIEDPAFHAPTVYQKGRTGLAPLRILGEKRSYGNPSAAWYDWSKYWESVAARTIGGLSAKVKKLDPSRPTMSWVTNSYAFGSQWDYVQWSSVPMDAVARDASGVDVLGLQLSSSYGDPYQISFGLDVARKYGKPMSVLDLLDFSLGVKTGFHNMMRATHASIQHGGSSFYYCCWAGAKDFEFFPDWSTEEMRRMIGEGKRSLAWMKGTEIKARGAIVNPYLPTVSSPWQPMQSPHSLMGWYKLLELAGETVDVVTLDDLGKAPGRLKGYDYVLLPDCPVMDGPAAEALQGYAKRGRLILGGRPPHRDPQNRPLSFAAGTRSAVLTDFGTALVGDPVRRNNAGDTPPMFDLSKIDYDRTAPMLVALKGAMAKLKVPSAPVQWSGGKVITKTDFRYRGGRGIYLVNHRPEAASVVVTAKAKRVSALIDGVERKIETDGKTINLPPFERAAILKMDQ